MPSPAGQWPHRILQISGAWIGRSSTDEERELVAFAGFGREPVTDHFSGRIRRGHGDGEAAARDIPALHRLAVHSTVVTLMAKRDPDAGEQIDWNGAINRVDGGGIKRDRRAGRPHRR